MGGGKGEIDHYVSRVKKGTVIAEIEVERFSDTRAKTILRKVITHLPLRARVIRRRMNF